ncbi:SLATT domain-containing protein [Pseudomonas lurida]|uniref:SLATT domain-containing protein n=1 Tax=Pseudomonas lurida TaxID=244566 RepID=A0ABY9FNG6_9PSED|nr:SLATT domain-containing protein [Pseudomonas lurida]WLH04853.1 SLATT domain-containing protein [Pseudomonas lurida]
MSDWKKVKEGWIWLWSLGPREKPATTAFEKLHMSMRTTVKCRFAAADRLKNYARFSFFTTTILSLGLILIPLIQNSQVALSVAPSVLNMMQIFLAVAVLVFSVVIGTAKYELRSELLTECGNRLKELIREMNRLKGTPEGSAPAELERLEKEYSRITTDVENHARVDYRRTWLDMRNDYFITGIPRLRFSIATHWFSFYPYLVPLILIGIEIMFVTDMLGVTTLLPKAFRTAGA